MADMASAGVFSAMNRTVNVRQIVVFLPLIA